MKQIEEFDVESLKRIVEKEFGSEIIYTKDCFALSVAVYEKTKRQLSESTLKRLWGLITSTFNPSKYTLDSLSLYVNYKNWETFVEDYGQSEDPQFLKQWTLIKTKAISITKYSLQSIKNRIGFDSNKTFQRHFANELLNSFLASGKRATAFVAPGGYGKSTIVAHCVTNFYEINSDKSNYILLLFDGRLFDSITNFHFNFKEYLIQLLSSEENELIETNIINILKRSPYPVIIIIDDIDDLYFRIELFEQFISTLLSLITQSESIFNLRFIITCDVNTWSQLILRIPNEAKKFWYRVNFEGDYLELCNLPPLNEEEIICLFQKNNIDETLDRIKLLNPEFIEILKVPYFLQLFIISSENFIELSDISLLHSFINRTVLSGVFAEIKFEILNSIIINCNRGLDSDTVNKNQIPEILNVPSAYRELIAHGLLYEIRSQQNYNEIERIKFTHEILFEFLIVNYWLRENNGLTIELLEQIFLFYKDNRSFLYALFRFFIKYAIIEQNINILKNIFYFITREFLTIESKTIYHTNAFELITIIGCELRKNEYLRKELIPFYASNPISRKYYFETFIDLDYIVLHYSSDIELYIQSMPSNETLIFGESIKFLSYFVSNDLEKCRIQFEKISLFTNFQRENTPFEGIQLSVEILFHQITGNPICVDPLMKRINVFFENQKDDFSNFSPLHFVLFDALFITDNFLMIKNLLEKKDWINSQINILNIKWTHKSTMLYYAYALLKTDEIEKAFSIYNQITIDYFPQNSKYFRTISYHLIQVHFLLYQQKFSEVNTLLRKIIDYAEMLKFKFFENKALQIKTMLMNENIFTH
jgi:hypothetical protein